MRPVFFALLAALAGCGSSSATPDAGGEDATPEDAGSPGAVRYSDAIFKATHNSFGGGTRGSIPQQLDHGVRFVELDIWDSGGIVVGHEQPGDDVVLGAGNPDTLDLGPWLDQIAAWSAAHPAHAPIVVMVDVHGDFLAATGTTPIALDRLESLLVSKLGPRAFRESELGVEWPTVDAIRGKLIAVISGSERARLEYRSRGGMIGFVEVQHGQTTVTADERSWFFAGAAAGREASPWVVEQRRAGKIGRLWSYNFATQATDPAVNFRATDQPDADWYVEECGRIGCIE
jgi:hypothetical protein